MAIIVVNFKAYRESIGANAVNLARKISSSKYGGVSVIAAVQAVDIFSVSRIMPVYAQHIDAVDFGAFTGSLMPEAAKENGAIGTVINHCEKPLDLPVIEKSIARAKSSGLKTIVCVPTAEIASSVAKFFPDIISIEPPSLVGSGKASSKFMPEIISQTLRNSGDIPVICGAGIVTAEDVKSAMDLGCHGIMVSSAVVKSGNPAGKISEFAGAMS